MSVRAGAHLYSFRIGSFTTTSGRDLLLGLLLLATLMMPVSYRAGTDSAHSHSVFQSMIDTVAGPHRHDQEADRSAPVAPSPFAPASVPLISTDSTTSVSSESDVADILASAPAPISPFSTMQVLGLFVASLLVSAAFTQRWPERVRLVSRSLAIEVPPPRLV